MLVRCFSPKCYAVSNTGIFDTGAARQLTYAQTGDVTVTSAEKDQVSFNSVIEPPRESPIFKNYRRCQFVHYLRELSRVQLSNYYDDLPVCTFCLSLGLKLCCV